MRNLVFALVTGLALGAAPTCLARASKVATAVATVPAQDAKRTVTLVGEIGGRATFLAADRVLALSTTPGDIYLVINSPGGGVVAGTFFLNALSIAQARGRHVVCAVSGMAASMAFQIFSYCDERYALRNAYLLFHPVRVGSNEPLTPLQAARLDRELQRAESTLVGDLRQRMSLDDETFWWHYHAETMWRADELLQLVPEYYQLVDDAPGISTLLPIAPSPFDQIKTGELVWGVSAATLAKLGGGQ